MGRFVVIFNFIYLVYANLEVGSSTMHEVIIIAVLYTMEMWMETEIIHQIIN